jgi:LmbE family N-acetylglucosaminyl deacetylase
MDDLGTILGIWAHPDDETWLSAGLMARAVAAGSRVVCVTATRGELGAQDPDRWPPEKLADIRTAELAESFAALGVTEHHWLDYPDGGCAAVDEDEAVARLTRIIADVVPDTMLTMGPDGMTGHPDHIAVSRWVTRAFVQEAPPGARLHYSTMLPEVWEQMRGEFYRLGVSMGGEPSITEAGDCSILYVLDDDALAVKDRAIRAQVSQVEGLFQQIDPEALAHDMRHESYRRAQWD